MFIIFGTRTAGRVYNADNQRVSTAFGHLFFVPLVPIASIQVVNKGVLRDTGTPIPLHKKSILAAYLRIAFFAAMCFGFAMAFDGLFLDDVVERDKPTLILVGISLFSGAAVVWLWACFVLG